MQLDLNLLTVLDALLEEGSVMGAAERLHLSSPGVRLRVLAENSVDTDDLRHGRVDLELGGARPGLPEFRSEPLGEDRLVVAMRADHPCAGRLDLASYAAQPHVVISRRGRLTAPVDDMLAAQGLRRRVIAAVATVASALQIAARGDALVTCTAILGRPLIEAFGLAVRPLPIESPPAAINCNWHQRYDSDPAHAWLREQVRASIEEITAC